MGAQREKERVIDLAEKKHAPKGLFLLVLFCLLFTWMAVGSGFYLLHQGKFPLPDREVIQTVPENPLTIDEEALQELRATVSEQQLRISAMQKQLDTPPPLPNADNNDPRVDQLLLKFEQLEEKLAEMVPETSDPRVDKMADNIVALQQELANIPREVAGEASASDARPVVMALSVMQLEHAIEAQDTLTLQAAQERLLIAAKDDPYLTPKVQLLSDVLDNNIPSRDRITEQFTVLIPKILAKREAASRHPLTRLVAEHVTIRRIDDAKSESIDDLVNRAEKALSDGEIVAFSTFVGVLKKRTELSALGALETQVKHYITLQKTLGDIRNHLVRHGVIAQDKPV